MSINQIPFLIWKIRYFSEKFSKENNIKETLHKIYKNLISDAELEPVFKSLIKAQLQKMLIENPGSQANGSEETKSISRKIRKELQKTIKKEFYKAIDKDNKPNQLRDRKKQEKAAEIIDIQQSEKQSKHSVVVIESSEMQIQQTQKDELSYGEKDERTKNSLASFSSDCRQQSQKVAKPEYPFLSQQAKTQRFGHFLYGDKIKAIVDHTAYANKERQLVLIEWYPRKNGIIPALSLVPFCQFVYFCPNEAQNYIKSHFEANKA